MTTRRTEVYPEHEARERARAAAASGWTPAAFALVLATLSLVALGSIGPTDLDAGADASQLLAHVRVRHAHLVFAFLVAVATLLASAKTVITRGRSVTAARAAGVAAVVALGQAAAVLSLGIRNGELAQRVGLLPL